MGVRMQLFHHGQTTLAPQSLSWLRNRVSRTREITSANLLNSCEVRYPG
jgi:hypothetical protein